jgi:prohibitin 2
VETLFLILFILSIIGTITFFAVDIYQQEENGPGVKWGKTIAHLIPFGLAMVFFFTLYSSVYTVNAGTEGVVTRNGAVNRVVAPGLHFKYPLVESVSPVTTQTLVVKPDEDASSHDLQVVHTQVTLAYHFDPAYVGYIYTQLADSSDNAVERKVVIPAILEAIKASTAKFDAQELISNRTTVRDNIEALVKDRLAPYHVVAETTSITDFHFSKDYEDAIEQKVTAAQNAEKAQNVLNQVKIEAQQKIAAAEGEAQALKAQKEQITPELLALRTIEMMANKWDGALPQNYYGGTAPLPMMEVFKAQKGTK